MIVENKNNKGKSNDEVLIVLAMLLLIGSTNLGGCLSIALSVLSGICSIAYLIRYGRKKEKRE